MEHDVGMIYRRKLEQWARAVADERQGLFDAVQGLAQKIARGESVTSDSWEFDRLFTRAHFLLVAVRNVWRFASGLRELEPDAPGMEHLPAFEQGLLSASEMRDFLEHFDDYARGAGRAQKKGLLPTPEDIGGLSFDEDQGFESLTYTFGGISVNLGHAHGWAMFAAQTILKKQYIRPEWEG